MKIRLGIVLKITAFSVFVGSVCLAQATDEKWTRIVGTKGEVSAAFPPGFIVDAEKRPGQVFGIKAWHAGAYITMNLIEDSITRNLFDGAAAVEDEKGTTFKIGSVRVKRFHTAESGKEYSERFFVYSDGRLYQIAARAPTSDNAQLVRFLYSISAGGSNIFSGPVDTTPETSLPVKSLKTSPEVIEARSRKQRDVKIIHKDESKFVAPPANVTSRPAIVVDRPNPPLSALRGNSGMLKAKAVIEYLASGEIGSITVYSANRSYAQACGEAAKKIKFIPALDGDKYVDSTGVQEYNLPVISFTTMIGVPRR